MIIHKKKKKNPLLIKIPLLKTRKERNPKGLLKIQKITKIKKKKPQAIH